MELLGKLFSIKKEEFSKINFRLAFYSQRMKTNSIKEDLCFLKDVSSLLNDPLNQD